MGLGIMRGLRFTNDSNNDSLDVNIVTGDSDFTRSFKIKKNTEIDREEVLRNVELLSNIDARLISKFILDINSDFILADELYIKYKNRTWLVTAQTLTPFGSIDIQKGNFVSTFDTILHSVAILLCNMSYSELVRVFKPFSNITLTVPNPGKRFVKSLEHKGMSKSFYLDCINKFRISELRDIVEDLNLMVGDYSYYIKKINSKLNRYNLYSLDSLIYDIFNMELNNLEKGKHKYKRIYKEKYDFYDKDKVSSLYLLDGILTDYDVTFKVNVIKTLDENIESVEVIPLSSNSMPLTTGILSEITFEELDKTDIEELQFINVNISHNI